MKGDGTRYLRRYRVRNADLCEHPRAREDAAGLRACRRAGAVHTITPISLHGEIAMSVFGMSKTVLRNLFSRPATRPYPGRAKEPHRTEKSRGRIEIDIEACIFCGAL